MRVDLHVQIRRPRPAGRTTRFRPARPDRILCSDEMEAADRTFGPPSSTSKGAFMKTTRAAIVLACSIVLTGCASAQYFSVKRADAIGPCATTVPQRDVLLGVAISGGGSRAALYGVGGLEALAGVQMPDGTSLIDHIQYLSSVSGGSLAATYYVLKKPGREVKVLNADGTLSEPYRVFFEQYRAALGQDFQTALIWRQLLSFRWVNSALAAQTLAEILQEKLYGKARIEDITAREKAGDSPGLIVNTKL